MFEKVSRPDLRQLPPNVGRQEFNRLITGMLTARDRAILGPNAAVQIKETLLMLSAMAPNPATFDNEGFLAIACFTPEGQPLPQEQADYLLRIAQQTGVVSENREDGRLALDPVAKSRLTYILDQEEAQP